MDKGRMATAVAKSANHALGLLIAKHKDFGGMPQDIYRQLYDALVTPIIEYAAANWGQQELSCISAIQNRACRYFMGVSKYTPNAAVQWEMSWKTAGHRQKLCVLRLWLRLMNTDREMIASKVFGHSCTLTKNLCLLTLNMFNELGKVFSQMKMDVLTSIVCLRQLITAFTVIQLFNSNTILIGKFEMAAIN